MNTIRNRIPPGLRGAIFYGAFWGAVGIFEPYINIYFMRLGIDATHIGWLAVIIPLCTVVIAPLVARFADRTHQRATFLAIGCLGFGLAITLPAFSSLWPGFRPTFPLLVMFVTICAIFRSPIISLADSLVATLSVRHNLDFGSMRLWGSIVFTLTAICLGFVWARTGYETMFMAAGISFLPVVFAALMLAEEGPHIQSPSPTSGVPAANPTDDPPSRLKMDLGVLCLISATFLVLEGLFMAGTFIPIYVSQLGGSDALAGAMIGMAALGEVPGMLFGSRISRRLGNTSALLVSYALTAAGLAGYALTRYPQVMLVFSVLRGFGFGIMLVSAVMIINTRAPRGFSSTYQGMLNAAGWGLAPLLGGPVSGWIFQTYGPQTLFLLAGGMSLAAGLIIAPTYWIWGKDQ
jgi:PPP family 3-phenylpropionic acid transporter